MPCCDTCLLYLVISCQPRQNFTACHTFQDDELEENLEEGEGQDGQDGEGPEPPSLLTADHADKAKA